MQQLLLQVEKYILTETHLSLCAFLQATTSIAIQEMAALLPVLCAHIAYYAEDDAIHKSIIDRSVATINSGGFDTI